MPHAIASDGRLSAMDVRVALALLSHARRRGTCYPSNGELGRYAHASVDTIQRSLRTLERLEYIRCDRSRPTRPNATGRVITLLWRDEEATASMPLPHRTGAMTPPQPCGTPAAPVPPKEDRCRKTEKNPKISDQIPASSQRQRPEPKSPGEPSRIGSEPQPSRPEKDRKDSSAPAPLASSPAQAPDEPRPISEPLMAAMEHAEQARSLAADPVVSGEPSSFAGPLPPPSGIERLTAEERAHLEDASPGTRARVLAWLAEDDPILLQEARKRLRPVVPPSCPPQTTVELLERIRESPHYPILAADRLAREFGDDRSRRGFEARCRAAYEGRLAPAALTEAYRQATGPRTRNPGAIFMHALK